MALSVSRQFLRIGEGFAANLTSERLPFGVVTSVDD